MEKVLETLPQRGSAKGLIKNIRGQRKANNIIYIGRWIKTQGLSFFITGLFLCAFPLCSLRSLW
jgi:hypothetical protein